MTGSTHVMAGLATLWLLEVAAWLGPLAKAPELTPLVLGAAALGALFPDLDAAESRIKHLRIGQVKPFFLPAQMIYRQLGHRTMLHSLWGLVYALCIAGLGAIWLGTFPALAFWLGYASHLLMDACTRSGIPLLYPRRTRYYALPPRWRFRTGSSAEEALAAGLALLVVLLMLLHLLHRNLAGAS